MNERIKKFLMKISAGQLAGAVFISAVVLRVGLWLVYGPVSYNDSLSYRRLAGQLIAGWINYDGSRVPGYPVLLAIVGPDDRLYLVQLVMGILITMGFYYMGWRISRNPWFGGLAAMLHQFNLGQLFFEANLLTETLATLFVTASLVGVLHGIYVPGARKGWLAFLIGVSAALAILTRPLFIVLPAWIFLWILLAWRDPPFFQNRKLTFLGQIKVALRTFQDSLSHLGWQMVAFSLPVVGLIGIWVGFIHYYYHDWALSTMTGYHLVQHTGAFFEYVPDEYAAIRDTYLRYREAHILEFGTQTNTIWLAIPEMQEESGLHFYDLSRTLSRISIQLIREHPLLFLRSAADGWWLFWRAPVYWSEGGFHNPFWLTPAIVTGMRRLVLLQRMLLFAANLFFMISPIILLLERKVFASVSRIMDRHQTSSLIILSGTVWLTSIVQALLDHGDNPRFLIPLQSVVVLWVAWWVVYRLPEWLNFIKSKTSAGTVG